MVESQDQATTSVTYELSIGAEEAELGTRKLLSRNGKKLEVNIPAGVKTGNTVKLTNALQVTDGRQGDILIRIKVKDEQSAGVVEVTDSTFQQEVLQSSVPVVVDFWAPWCGPCRTIAPITEKLANEYQGSIKFCKINVDENRQTAERFQVMSIPLLIFFKDGEAVDQSVGAVSEDALRSKLESMI